MKKLPVHLSRPSPKSAAFTLIELLVVIAIIAILAGLIFPAVSGAQARSKQAKCVAQLRQWAQAISMYANDNQQQVQWDGVFSATHTSGPYMPYFTGPDMQYQMRWCPAVAWSGGGNAPVCYEFIRPNLPNGSPISGSPYRLSQVSHAADLMMIVDAQPPGANEFIGANGDTFDNAVKPICVSTPNVSIRHSGGVNALFADFHVRYIFWSELDGTTTQGTTNRKSWTTLQ